MKPLGASICAVALLAAAPSVAQQRMPGLAPSPESAEAGLWTASERAEQQARMSARLNADPVLNAYVRDLACEAAPEYCDELRVYVMDQPAFNAMAAPNGYLEIWSGLLLRGSARWRPWPHSIRPAGGWTGSDTGPPFVRTFRPGSAWSWTGAISMACWC